MGTRFPGYRPQGGSRIRYRISVSVEFDKETISGKSGGRKGYDSSHGGRSDIFDEVAERIGWDDFHRLNVQPMSLEDE